VERGLLPYYKGKQVLRLAERERHLAHDSNKYVEEREGESHPAHGSMDTAERVQRDPKHVGEEAVVRTDEERSHVDQRKGAGLQASFRR
jgi:hypothetical protein